MKKIIFASFLWLVLISLVIADLIDMTYMEIIPTIKDIILACCAIVGAFVALKGLGTWQRQLKGQAEYDLSRRLLVGLYRYRDAIDHVRCGMMWPSEMPQPPKDESDQMTQNEIIFYGRLKGFENRWNKLQEQRTKLYADLVESEAIWNDELYNLFKPIWNLEYRLFLALSNCIESERPQSNNRFSAEVEISQDSRNTLFDKSMPDRPDDFKKEWLDAVERIETYLKQKLKH